MYQLMNKFKRNIRDIGAVAKRELHQMFARPLYIYSSVIVMALCTFFFLSVMQETTPQRIPIAIIDHDESTISRRFIHEVEATQSVHVVAVYGTYREAREAMQRGEIYAFLEIPKRFYADILAQRRPHLCFYVNNAYTMGANTAYKQLFMMANLANGAVQQQTLRARGMDENIIQNLIQPIMIEGHFIANPFSSYPVYLLSTILPGILGLIILMLTIFAIGFELKMGTSREWMKVANYNYTVAMIGKLLPYTILFIILGTSCETILVKFMHFPVNGSYLRLIGGMILYVFAVESVGITLIGAMPVLRPAISVGALYGMLSFSISGFTFPTMGMLPFVQALSYLFSLRHFYHIYVNEALMAAPMQNSIIEITLLIGFMVLPMFVHRRLHAALILQNYKRV